VDKQEYPLEAVREAILNALIHRDYSIHTEGMPIQLLMFKDRLVIRNPGGLYGRIKLDQLGIIQPDTRNPVIATMMEDLGLTENRYSGIPTIRKEMQNSGLMQPIFDDSRNNFTIKLLNAPATNNLKRDLVSFCSIPRSRTEISEYLGLGTSYYAIQQYILPLIQEGKLVMTIPEKPRSKHQKFVAK
jgi:ATP-dependent DNA helicase RecG